MLKTLHNRSLKMESEIQDQSTFNLQRPKCNSTHIEIVQTEKDLYIWPTKSYKCNHCGYAWEYVSNEV